LATKKFDKLPWENNSQKPNNADYKMVKGKKVYTSLPWENENINVDKIWTKVNITTEHKFERRKYSISKVDIEKGLSLITDQELKTKVKEEIKPFLKNFN
jgi:hypothetical protein